MKALYRVSDGFIILPNIVKELTGEKEIENLKNGVWDIIDYGDNISDHVNADHCYVVMGSIELKPESEWIENQPGYMGVSV